VTVFVVVPQWHRSYKFGISKRRAARMNAGVQLPLVAYKSGLFLRVHIYKLIRVLEGKFPQSIFDIRLLDVQFLVGRLEQAHPLRRPNDRRTIREGNVL